MLRQFETDVDLDVWQLRDVSANGPDVVNSGTVGTAPEKFKDRKLYRHNSTVTLMRTTVEENRMLGEEIGRKAAAATGPTCIMIAVKGVSAIDQTGKAFDDPAARQALYDGSSFDPVNTGPRLSGEKKASFTEGSHPQPAPR